jgi:transcriptional regulator GlxA family with amidase domain
MRHVVFAAVSPIQILDLTAPFEIFARCGGYSVQLVSSASNGEVISTCGLRLQGAVHYPRLRGAVDTLLVPGGDGAEQLACDPAFLRWLAKMSTRVRRIGSVCTGATLLAASGILERKRAVTHWKWCDQLAHAFPNVRVERDPIYIKDGHVYTSAGITAGIDLALALVEEDHGQTRALEIAKDLVIFLRRPGGQSQFSNLLAAQVSARRPLEDLHAWVMENLDQDLSVGVLASRCGMSARHFARVFAADKGLTPGKFVERCRVDAARALIGSTNDGIKEIAAKCGFGSLDSMRRSFNKILGVTTRAYADGFRSRKPSSRVNPLNRLGDGANVKHVGR